MSIRSLTAALVLGTALLSAQAQAADYLMPYVGYFDVTQQDDSAAEFGLEYRFNPYQYGIRPMVGFSATTDSAYYAYGGFAWDVELLKNELYLVPNFAAGIYSKGDEGKSLGGVVEFRSGIELAYQLKNTHRVSVAFNHRSNASIYDKNPGVETLLVGYSIPTTSILGY